MLNKNGQRELAYVVLIDEIMPIEGYDRVELARVGGWHVIVQKGQFKVGDPAVYFEVDSKVPSDRECFAFLAKRKYKIKTIKMCGVVSQGLLMHANDFGWASDFHSIVDEKCDFHNADDESRFLTEILGVVHIEDEDNVKSTPVDKYKAMAQRRPNIFKQKWARWLMRREWGRKLMFALFGRKKKKSETAFPTKFPFVHKSDEERIENCTFYLKDQEHKWIKTVKIDGTSSLYVLERKPFNRREYYVCSRNVRQLNENQKCYHSDNVYWSVEHKFHIRDFLEAMLKIHPDWQYVAVQGETAGVGEDGAKIQGDPHQFGELRFFAYNFIDPINGRWNSVAAKTLLESFGIEFVPIVDKEYTLPDNIEDFKREADGECEAPGAHGMREGYVYRRCDDCNISFKNVSNLYLLKHNI